jgi:predicted dehydrogenase
MRLVVKLGVAIVGAGMIGRAHARAFRQLRESFQPAPAEIELTMVADADAALAADAQARWGFARVASDWQAVAEANDVDIAVVALPNFQHAVAVDALLARGKHILCEKPLANTPRDAAKMVEAAERAGIVHGVGFNLRRAPAIAAIRGLVERGELGEIEHFSARYMTDYAASPEVPFTWRYDRSLAGSGALGDVASHVIDLARFLVGDLDSIRGAVLATVIGERFVPSGHVTGHSRAATTGERRAVDTDDLGSFTATFASGAIGDFRFSRIAHGYRNSPALAMSGTRGAIEFDMERAAELQLHTVASDADEPFNGFRRVVMGPSHPYFAQVTAFPVSGVGYGYGETYVGQAYEFVRAVAEGTRYAPGFADGYSAVAVCDAVLESAEVQRAVPVARAPVSGVPVE